MDRSDFGARLPAAPTRAGPASPAGQLKWAVARQAEVSREIINNFIQFRLGSPTQVCTHLRAPERLWPGARGAHVPPAY